MNVDTTAISTIIITSRTKAIKTFYNFITYNFTI